MVESATGWSRFGRRWSQKVIPVKTVTCYIICFYLYVFICGTQFDVMSSDGGWIATLPSTCRVVISTNEVRRNLTAQ